MRRRGVAGAMISLLALAGCSAEGEPGDDRDPAPSASEAPPVPVLPDPNAYAVAEYEPAPEVKAAAIGFLEAALNYAAGAEGIARARERVAADVASDQALSAIEPLLEDPTATGVEVVYPQLGGLTSTAASVISVVDLYRAGVPEAVGRRLVLDVRLESRETGWIVSNVDSIGGDLSGHSSADLAGADEAVRGLVASEGVELPDTATQDLLNGGIDNRVIALVTDLGKEFELSVTVLKTGHAHEVFGTDRQSNHSRGRAVDIWKINGQPVSYWAEQPAESNPARELMSLALAGGSDEVGGPWAFSTADGTTFTNQVHIDHVHIGFDAAA
jgi:hypothetical protein